MIMNFRACSLKLRHQINEDNDVKKCTDAQEFSVETKFIFS